MNQAKTRAMAIGGIVGALLGMVAGLIYYNSYVAVDEEGREHLPAPSASIAVKLGLSLLGVLRLIAE